MKKKISTLLFIGSIALLHFAALGITFPLLSSMLFAPGFELLGGQSSHAERSLWLSFILGAVPLSQLLSAPILGTLSDSWGRKRALIYAQLFGLVAYGIGMVGVYFHQILLVFISRILVGISSGTSAIQGAVISDITTPAEKIEYFGYLGMFSGLGFAIGPSLGGLLFDASFLSFNPYLLPFGVAFLCMCLSMFLIRSFFQETEVVSRPHTQTVLECIYKEAKLAARPLFLICFACVFLFYFGWSFYWNFSPVLWISRLAFSPKEISYMYSYGAIVFAIASGLFIHPIVKRFQVSSILFYALFFLSLTFLCLLFTPSTCTLLLFVPLQQYFLSLFMPSIATILSTHTSPKEQGEVMGLFQSVHAIGDALGPIISAPLMGYTSASPLLVGIVCMVAGCLVIKFFLEKKLIKENLVGKILPIRLRR